MSSFEVRPFRRSDREQLTALVRGHVDAVVPGVSVSVNRVLSQLEREPGEFIVDPWVLERRTLVAEQRGAIVAAAHLLRYAASEAVGESYRNAGELRWYLFWPARPSDARHWPDATDAEPALMAACLEQLDAWGVTLQYADGTLPAPGVYGVPEQWPHIRAAYERSGFVHDGRTEIVLSAAVAELVGPGDPPLAGLEVRRTVGINGTRLSAALGDHAVGYVEVERLEEADRSPRNGGLADIGNLEIEAAYRRRGVGSWLVRHAAEWLALAGVERVLDYAVPEDEQCLLFLEHLGFRELTRTARGWVRAAALASSREASAGHSSR